MNNKTTPLPEDFPKDSNISEQAFYWVAKRKTEETAPDLEDAFILWHAEKSDHAHAYERALTLWEGLVDVPSIEKVITSDEDSNVVDFKTPADNTQKTGRFEWPQNQILWTLAASIAIFGFAALFLFSGVYSPAKINEVETNATVAVEYVEYETQPGELKVVTLADGTHIHLNGGSKVQVGFLPQERHVNLLAGQVFFNVFSDSERPFIVKTETTSVTVLGTEFDLRIGQRETVVSVREGRVNVQPLKGVFGNLGTKILTIGQTISVQNDGLLRAVRSIDESQISSWREGRLFYEDAPLGELIQDLNRVSDTHWELADQALYDLKITLSVNIDQIGDGFAESVAKSLGLTTEKDGFKVTFAKDE